LKTLVVDGSAMLGIVIEDEHAHTTAATIEALREPRLLPVPAHWWIEVTNGLLMAERRKRLTQVGFAEAIRFIRTFPMVVDPETDSRATSETCALARHFNLTIYDAAYLELAIRRSSVLATVDKALARAAEASGVELLYVRK
jgi:predicted nucleic acid-binding protein